MKLYELDIDGDTSEVYCNSIVSVPAHLKAALKFKEDEKPLRFAFDEEKQIVTGVVISVDEPIPRFDPETKEEFNVVFRKNVADKIMLDYFKKGYANKVTLEHDDNKPLTSAFLFESYQIDLTRGNSVPDAFKSQELKDGSIIFSYKVEDKDEWESVKNMGGFSIEGVFNLIEVTNQKNEQMSLLEKIGFKKQAEETITLEKFQETNQNFAQAETTEGIIVVWDGEIAEGTEVFAEVDGVLTPAEGTHTLTGDMDGVVVTIEGGVVTSVTMPEEEEMPEDNGEFAKEDEVAEAFKAMEEKFNAKVEQLETAFEAKIKAKEQALTALQTEFEAVKKIAPAPLKSKFKKEEKQLSSATVNKADEILKNILKK
jgi:hypothetical protein